MSEIVNLDPGRARRAEKCEQGSRTALVLGGGGFTGGVYETAPFARLIS